MRTVLRNDRTRLGAFRLTFSAITVCHWVVAQRPGALQGCWALGLLWGYGPWGCCGEASVWEIVVREQLHSAQCATVWWYPLKLNGAFAGRVQSCIVVLVALLLCRFMMDEQSVLAPEEPLNGLLPPQLEWLDVLIHTKYILSEFSLNAAVVCSNIHRGRKKGRDCASKPVGKPVGIMALATVNKTLLGAKHSNGFYQMWVCVLFCR